MLLSCSVVSDSLQPHKPQHGKVPVHHQLPEFTQTHVHWSVMSSNHLILCRPHLLLPSIFPNIRAFSNESTLHIRWPKYWNVSFNISPSNHSVVSDPLWPHGLQHARLPVLYQLLELAQTQVHWVGDTIHPSHPLLSPSPAFNLFQHQGLFKWVNSSHQVAKVLELQLQHQSFQWYSGLISFRIDWLDLLAVQGTLKSLLQHHCSEASILPCSAFFTVQLSHLYITTGKTIALTICTLWAK